MYIAGNEGEMSSGRENCQLIYLTTLFSSSGYMIVSNEL